MTECIQLNFNLLLILQALGLSFFSTKTLSSLLQSILPAQWFRANLVIPMDHPDPPTQPGHARRFGFIGSLSQQRIPPERTDHFSMHWDRGAQDGSPSPLWLRKIWELISGLILKGMIRGGIAADSFAA